MANRLVRILCHAAHMKTVSLAWCIGHLRVDVRACRMCAQFSHVPLVPAASVALSVSLCRSSGLTRDCGRGRILLQCRDAEPSRRVRTGV